MLGYTYRVLTVNYLDIAIWESTVSQLANRRHHGTAVFPANKIRLLHGLSIYLSIYLKYTCTSSVYINLKI